MTGQTFVIALIAAQQSKLN